MTRAARVNAIAFGLSRALSVADDPALGAPAAVDPKRRPRDERAVLVVGEVEHRPGDLVWLAEAVKRRPRRVALDVDHAVVDPLLDERRPGDARRDGVHAHAAVGPLDRQH